jgi:DNA-binding NtrC family response regulator
MKTVLVIEDQDDLRETLRTCLSLDGYTVALAPSREEGLEIASKRHVDFAILDYCMPGMPMEEFVPKLRVIHPTVMCILMSGVDDGKGFAEALAIKHWLKKPFDLEQLLRILK